MIPGWIISTTSCFTLPPCCSSLSHIPDLNLISLWELESLPPMVWLWARQAEFSVPGTVVVVKSCLMDRRLFRCLGLFFFFPSKYPGNVQEQILELRELTLQRPWCQKDPHVLNIAESQREPRALSFQRMFFKKPQTSHFFVLLLQKSSLLFFKICLWLLSHNVSFIRSSAVVYILLEQ